MHHADASAVRAVVCEATWGYRLEDVLSLRVRAVMYERLALRSHVVPGRAQRDDVRHAALPTLRQQRLKSVRMRFLWGSGAGVPPEEAAVAD